MPRSSLNRALLTLCALLGSSIFAYDVNVTSDHGESVLAGTPVTFNAVNSGATTESAYVWNFDDNTPPVTVIGSPFVTHTFTSADLFAVSVSIDNGMGSDFILLEVIVPPNPAASVGIDTTDPNLKKVTNPDNGLGFELDQSQGGFISGTLDLDAAKSAPRDDLAFTTDFGDGVSGRDGSSVQHRYLKAGIYIMTNGATSSGSDLGINRKTLAFSEDEINGQFSDPNVTDPGLANRRLHFKSTKGKFHFGQSTNGTQLGADRAQAKPTNDTVSVTWTMTLPAGFDVTTQTVQLAIGNVVDSVPLNKSGKGIVPDGSPYKSVHFKFPRPAKGLTRSASTFVSSVTVQMSAADLTGSGFDTEGISSRQSLLEKSSGPFARKIQVATSFAGVTYAGAAVVQLNVSKDSVFGTIAGRAN